jgi:putative membrane protein
MENKNSTINKDLILRERLALERTQMANDRTLLSFVRTSLYFLIAGLTIDSLIEVIYGTFTRWSLWGFSILCLIVGVIRYIKQKKKLKENEKHIGDYKMAYDDDEV